MVPANFEPTVLVVEDEVDFREVVRLRLENVGFNVLEASNAGDAWVVARENELHAVVVDVRLPGIDGGSLARQLRKVLARAVPIVAFTAWPDLDRGRSLAFDALHVKPEIESVISSLRRLMSPPAGPGGGSGEPEERLPGTGPGPAASPRSPTRACGAFGARRGPGPAGWRPSRGAARSPARPQAH